MTATGNPALLRLTRSAALASSSPTAGAVTSSTRPCVSVVPRRSSSSVTPLPPMTTSVWPSRQGRPSVSVTMTPIATSKRSTRALRIAAAEASGSCGSSRTVPAGVFDASTPAAAPTMPRWFSTILVMPLGKAPVATTRTVSSVIACSRSVRSNDSPLRLRDDLGADDDDVAVFRRARARDGVADDQAEVHTRLDLRNALEREDTEASRHRRL